MRLASSILCLLASALVALGSEVHYSFTRLSLNEGLSSPTVKAICKDRTGIMWAGTTKGMDRFSASGHSSYSLGGDPVISVAEDSLGTLWATTFSNAYIYDRGSDSFRNLDCGACGHCVCHGDEVWVYNFTTLCRFRAGSAEFLKQEDFPINIDLFAVTFLPDGTPLLGTRMSGIWKYNPDDGSIELFSDRTIKELSCMYVHEGRLFAGSRGEGVSVFDLDGRFLEKIGDLPSEFICDISCCDGKLWIGTDGGGLSLYDLESGVTTALRHVPGDSGTLPSDAIYVVCADQDDIWLGTVRYGLINVRQNYIRTYGEAVLGSTTGLSERCAFGLYRDADGCVWIGTDGQGINHFDPSTGAFTHYPETYGDYIPTISGYSDDELLVMRFHKGMFLFNKKTGRYRPFMVNGKPADSGEWNNQYIQYSFKVSDRLLYTFGIYAYAHDLRNGSVTRLVNSSGDPTYEMKMAWYDQSLMLCTLGNGLHYNDYTDFTLHSLCNVGSEGNISCAALDRAGGRLWVGIENGFGWFEFNPGQPGATPEDSAKAISTGRFHRIEGVPFKLSTTLSVDGAGRVWIAADAQLFLYYPDNGTFRCFGDFDGYERNDILMGYSPLCRDGQVFWSGSSGLVSISTALADMGMYGKTPRMSISEIISDNKRYVFNEGREKNVRIPWNHGTLSLNYSVSDIRFYDNAIYTYIISGKDDRVVTSKSATLDLTALAPGDYVIKASCQTASSEPASSFETLKVMVRPPFYKTKAFNAAILLLLVLGIAFATLSYAEKNLTRSGMVESAISDNDKEFMKRFDALVQENMSSAEINSDFLTKELGISRTGLYDKVRNLTGYSLNEYIKRQRIEKAISLLTDTDMSIVEISEATGFSYPRYFSSLFKELTGSTPTQFRKARQDSSSRKRR